MRKEVYSVFKVWIDPSEENNNLQEEECFEHFPGIEGGGVKDRVEELTIWARETDQPGVEFFAWSGQYDICPKCKKTYEQIFEQ